MREIHLLSKMPEMGSRASLSWRLPVNRGHVSKRRILEGGSMTRLTFYTLLVCCKNRTRRYFVTNQWCRSLKMLTLIKRRLRMKKKSPHAVALLKSSNKKKPRSNVSASRPVIRCFGSIKRKPTLWSKESKIWRPNSKRESMQLFSVTERPCRGSVKSTKKLQAWWTSRSVLSESRNATRKMS